MKRVISGRFGHELNPMGTVIGHRYGVQLCDKNSRWDLSAMLVLKSVSSHEGLVDQDSRCCLHKGGMTHGFFDANEIPKQTPLTYRK